MTTRTKLNLASLTSSVMALLSVFSHPLGIPNDVQLALMIGVFVPLGLTFFYIKKLKAEQAGGVPADARQSKEMLDAQQKIKKRLMLGWAIAAACALAAPVWLPITGTSLGIRGDLLVGISTATIVSVIFGLRLKKIEKPPSSLTPPPAAS